MDESLSWHVVKVSNGNCKIVSREPAPVDDKEIIEKWGPFDSKEEAITRRIGLIRTGKCQPV